MAVNLEDAAGRVRAAERTRGLASRERDAWAWTEASTVPSVPGKR